MSTSRFASTANLVCFEDIKKEPITGWREFLQEGNQFLATAQKAYSNRRKAFTAEILYNLVAMAIEKHLMALLMRSGNLPYNHTMHDLAEAMEEFLPGRLMDINKELKALDSYQEICDTESYNIVTPNMGEVARMLELAGKVQDLTLTHITD